jgi:hypothetical protein
MPSLPDRLAAALDRYRRERALLRRDLRVAVAWYLASPQLGPHHDRLLPVLEFQHRAASPAEPPPHPHPGLPPVLLPHWDATQKRWVTAATPWEDQLGATLRWRISRLYTTPQGRKRLGHGRSLTVDYRGSQPPSPPPAALLRSHVVMDHPDPASVLREFGERWQTISGLYHAYVRLGRWPLAIDNALAPMERLAPSDQSGASTAPADS